MQRGFSLVELSIVLIIIGLLVGGVVSGKALIRRAELRDIIAGFQQYQIAVNSFQEQYKSLPGDMPNATRFWDQAAAGSACYTTVSTGTKTCNGNGDGIIDYAGAANQRTEVFMFWQHLANAGLIPGKYTGMAGPDTLADHVFDENAPLSKMSGIGWGSSWADNRNGSIPNVWSKNYTGWLTLGGDDGIWADNYNGVMSAEEVWSIDTKIDDGLPGVGFINVYPTNCSDQASNTNWQIAQYLTVSDSRSCTIVVSTKKN